MIIFKILFKINSPIIVLNALRGTLNTEGLLTIASSYNLIRESRENFLLPARLTPHKRYKKMEKRHGQKHLRRELRKKKLQFRKQTIFERKKNGGKLKICFGRCFFFLFHIGASSYLNARIMIVPAVQDNCFIVISSIFFSFSRLCNTTHELSFKRSQYLRI